MDLRTAVSLLPTPRARDGKGRALSGDGLVDAVKLLPTPMAGDAKGTRNATAGRSKDNPNVNEGWTLSDVVYDGQLSQLLPTPTASDAERTSLSYGRGNPTLTGAITDPPSDGGNESSDDPHHGQLTLLDD